MQKVVRVDAGPEDAQRRLAAAPVHARRAAGVAPHTVRLVALARGGRVWFDEFDLLHLRPTKPVTPRICQPSGIRARRAEERGRGQQLFSRRRNHA